MIEDTTSPVHAAVDFAVTQLVGARNSILQAISLLQKEYADAMDQVAGHQTLLDAALANTADIRQAGEHLDQVYARIGHLMDPQAVEEDARG